MTTNQPEQEDRLSRIEEILNRAARLTLQNSEAIAGLEATAERHDNLLSRLEANSARHDETLSRLEANITRHEEAFFRIEGSIIDLNTQPQQTNRTVEALSQTQAECLQLIATTTIEINRIWQYLERRTGNGRGDGGQA